MILGLALASLGFLIGNLVGMTATSVVTSLVGLLFAFGGGSAIALLEKLQADARRVAGQCILAVSLGCLAGLYVGIVVSEHRLLSPRDPVTGAAPARIGVEKYVRKDMTEVADMIDYERRQRIISTEQAYERLLEAVRAKTGR